METGDVPWRPVRSELTWPRSARDADASRSFARAAAGDTRAVDRRDRAAPPSSPGNGDPPLEHFLASPPSSTSVSSTDTADHTSDRVKIPPRIAGTSAAVTTARHGSRRHRGLRGPTVRSTINGVDRPSCGRLTSAARSHLLRAAVFLGRCRRRLYDNTALVSKTDAALQGRGGHPLGLPRRRSLHQDSTDEPRAPPRSS